MGKDYRRDKFFERKSKAIKNEDEEEWDWNKYQEDMMEEEKKDLDFAEEFTNIKDMDLDYYPDFDKPEGE